MWMNWLIPVSYTHLDVYKRQESSDTDHVYPFFDLFADMIEDENSYVRTRGLLLIAANARWDTENKIDELIDSYLKHIEDVKPITSRQCIKALPSIVKYKPDLYDCICTALEQANPGIYRDSMSSLVMSCLLYTSRCV